MNLLLDTHIALWAVFDHPRLPPRARELIVDPPNAVVVSAASIWEIAIKHSMKRGRGIPEMPVSASHALKLFQEAGYRLLTITAAHARAVEDLPAIHNDPFDRILVAQALLEPLRLVTHDESVARYNDTVILI